MPYNRLRNYIKQEWTWLKLSYTFLFAHHPTCDRYADQIFDVFGIRLCQGCTIATSSTIIVTLLLAILSLSISLIVYGSIILLALVIVIVVDGNNLSRRYKRLARVSIGIIGGTLIYLIFFKTWLIKIISLLVSGIILVAYKKAREIKPSQDLCKECPQLPDAPYCDGIEEKMIANQQYRSIILPMTDQSIQERMQQLAENYVPPDNEI